MTDFQGEYGLGCNQPYAGNRGTHGPDVSTWPGHAAYRDGTVIVVLSNQIVDDIGGWPAP
jgi:hypothetical protein